MSQEAYPGEEKKSLKREGNELHQPAKRSKTLTSWLLKPPTETVATIIASTTSESSASIHSSLATDSIAAANPLESLINVDSPQQPKHIDFPIQEERNRRYKFQTSYWYIVSIHGCIGLQR